MASLTLEQHNRRHLLESIPEDAWMVCCLCAAWCDSCRDYRPVFEQLAARHPAVFCLWIDIEDQADLVGEIDVENFPTLLIQRGEVVAFFGAVAPALQLAERLLQAQLGQTTGQLQADANSSPERQRWQRQCNLRALLRAAA